MPVLLRVLAVLRAHVARIGGAFLAVMFLAHLLGSWGLMVLAGEEKLIALDVWPYFYVVTATTIGYGDFSPQTPAGRWVDILFVMPGGIGLFAALIGKTTSILVDFWRKGMRGKRDYSDLESHTVIIGWHGEATERMVDLLLEDSITRTDKIVLCVTDDIENPLPHKVLFVRGESFAQPSLLKRAGVSSAERILIYGRSDEQTLATAFAVLSHKPIGHVVVHFNSEESADLLHRHHPQVECTRSLAVDMLVRAAQDPGISRVTADLLSINSGPTEYSLRLPHAADIARFGDLLLRFKQHYNATLLGFAREGDGGGLRLNPRFDEPVGGGDLLYYMADARIDVERLDWAIAERGVA